MNLKFFTIFPNVLQFLEFKEFFKIFFWSGGFLLVLIRFEILLKCFFLNFLEFWEIIFEFLQNFIWFLHIFKLLRKFSIIYEFSRIFRTLMTSRSSYGIIENFWVFILNFTILRNFNSFFKIFLEFLNVFWIF